MANGNIENLVSLANRTTEEQREIATMGGKASGEARRQKKAMREMLEICLEMKNNDGLTYRQLATMGLIDGAIKGNAQNYRTMLETLGELKSVEEDKLANNIGKVEDLLLKLNEEAKK